MDFELEVELQAAYSHYNMTVDNAGMYFVALFWGIQLDFFATGIFVMTAMLGVFWPYRQVWNMGYTTFHILLGLGYHVLIVFPFISCFYPSLFVAKMIVIRSHG